MADWYGTTRSNYFKVKDIVEFRAMMSSFDVEIVVKPDTQDTVCFLATTHNGAIPTYHPTDDLHEISIVDVIAPHLADNQVCIIQEVGAEAKRYLTGTSIAISSTGEQVEVSINDIYKLAQNTFGGDAVITEVIL